MRLPTLIAAAMLATATRAAPLVTNVPTLTVAGATRALADAQTRATASNNPSAIAVVDASGLLIAFVRMDGVRPGSVDLAIGKARAAAYMRRPTSELEDNVSKGRVGLATAGLTTLRGGAPIMVRGQCVGAVGIAGLSKEADTTIANDVAALIGAAS